MFTETAFAKINLALHVRARRVDGYHAIETLFAFVDDGDMLSCAVADADSLTITGEFAGGLSVGPDNLVLRALVLARELGALVPPLAIHLDKCLPVAAGLGGGSADAGAMLRLIVRNFHCPLTLEQIAAASVLLGADVPACVLSRTMRASGIGDVLDPVGERDVTGMPVLLVNPGVPLATGPVFAAWDGVDRGGLGEGDVRAQMLAGRNDLQAPAMGLCSSIADVLTVLRAQLPLVARLSGSGATCFALFDDLAMMESAARRIWDDHPDWWLMAGRLR